MESCQKWKGTDGRNSGAWRSCVMRVGRRRAYLGGISNPDRDFFPYVYSYCEANEPFERGIEIGDAEPIRADLHLAGSERTYLFPNMQLRRVQMGVTRRKRLRIYEFECDNIGVGEMNMQLTNSDTRELAYGPLGRDYMFATTGPAQHLPGFDASTAPEQPGAVRCLYVNEVYGNLPGLAEPSLSDVADMTRDPSGHTRLQVPEYTLGELTQ